MTGARYAEDEAQQRPVKEVRLLGAFLFCRVNTLIALSNDPMSRLGARVDISRLRFDS